MSGISRIFHVYIYIGSVVPIEAKFEKPHRAYVVTNIDRSLTNKQQMKMHAKNSLCLISITFQIICMLPGIFKVLFLYRSNVLLKMISLRKLIV